MRLVGGSGLHEGCAEVLHNGAWGTVCSGGWDMQDVVLVQCKLFNLVLPR